jgi:DNA replication protein DnaC
MIGPSGLGKTHLLIALGRVACLQGYRVLFRTAATLAGELELAQAEHRLPKRLRHYQKYHLVLVDELGYLPFARRPLPSCSFSSSPTDTNGEVS